MQGKTPLQICCAITVSIVFCSTVGAQENPLGQPLLDAAGNIREDAFIRIPLRAEDQKYADIDGYFDSASDNASGVAVMMGLIKHFSQVPRSQRRRNLIFMSSLGHHSGPGARWLHDEKDSALANTAMVINLEHVALVRTKYWGPSLRKMNAVSPMRWWLWGSEQLLDIVLDSFQSFNVAITGDMENRASGEMGAVARDITSLQVITSPEIKHTEQDTAEWVPMVGLEQIARAYAKIIDGANALHIDELRPAFSN